MYDNQKYTMHGLQTCLTALQGRSAPAEVAIVYMKWK